MTDGENRKISAIHLLRGLTIAVIVYRHTLSYFDARSLQTSLLANIADEFFFNWTIFFVLLSGYLFQHLAYRYATRKYWLSKLKNVIAPYLMVSVVTFFLLHYSTISSLPLTSPQGEDLPSWILRMLLTGAHSEPYWYIPMITVIFLLGPFLHALSQRDLTVAGVVCLLLSVLTYKPETYETLKNVLHYLPVYIFGMMVCQKHRQLRGMVRDNRWLLAAFFLAIMASSLNTKLGGIAVNATKDYLMSIEKIVLFILLLFGLETIRLPAAVQRLLSHLADISFAIYFIHMIVVHKLLAIVEGLAWWTAITRFESGVASTLMNGAFTVVVLCICAAVVYCIKVIAGKWSRLLIGA